MLESQQPVKSTRRHETIHKYIPKQLSIILTYVRSNTDTQSQHGAVRDLLVQCRLLVVENRKTGVWPGPDPEIQQLYFALWDQQHIPV